MLALTKYRLELGLSINQLADAADVNPKTLQYQENGRTIVVYPKTARKITDALGVGLWDVYQCVYDRQLVCRESMADMPTSPRIGIVAKGVE